MKIFRGDKRMFNFSNYSTKSKYYDHSMQLVFGKMKEKTTGVAIEEYFELRPNMYSLVVENNRKHKKQRGCCYVAAIMIPNEKKYVLLKNKLIRH